MNRVRLVLILTRPAVVFLLAAYAVVGFAQAGATPGGPKLFVDLLVVMAYLLFSVAVNDIADAPIDRCNLPGSNRPLVTGRADEREMRAIAAVSAVVALGVAMFVSWLILIVVAAALLLSAAYSLPPVRLAARGALAAMVLPAGYVATPYLVGLLSIRSSMTPRDAALLAGLYLGFIGRILLKDFRDVRGDALFGKRTFLVRHGRRATCVISAGFWTTGGAVILIATRRPSVGYLGCSLVGIIGVLVALRALADDRGPRRDETLISCMAIAGRGVLVLLLAQLAMLDKGWHQLVISLALLAISVPTVGAVATTLRHGPSSNLVLRTAAQSDVTAATAR